MTDALPLVSCVMVTQASRRSLAQQAIRDFIWQTYPNKELVIVADDEPTIGELTVYGQALGGCVRSYFADPDLPLGALRNIGSVSATGEWICQWDDDDRYHPQRIAIQMQAVGSQFAACFLTEQLHLFVSSQHLFWSDWARRARGNQAMIPGTVLYRKDTLLLYPEEGPHAVKGEDSIFREDIAYRYPVAALPQCGWLYLRQYHGNNTWDHAHHQRVIRDRSLSAEQLTPRLPALRSALAAFGVPLQWLSTIHKGQAVYYRDLA